MQIAASSVPFIYNFFAILGPADPQKSCLRGKTAENNRLIQSLRDWHARCSSSARL